MPLYGDWLVRSAPDAGKAADAAGGAALSVVSTSGLAALDGSALVGFAHATTGAVLRTVLDKLRDVSVTPEDFGAVGDLAQRGVTGTGTTTNLSNSVTQVRASGTFAIGQTITGAGIPAGTTITGYAAGVITLSQNATATASRVALTAAGCTITAASNQLSGGWVTGDIGKRVVVQGAGTNGFPLCTSITAVVSGTATLADNAVASVTNALVDYGTDNSVALEQMFNNFAVTTGGASIHIPHGRGYGSITPLNVKSDTAWFGGGTIASLKPHGAGGFILLKNAVRNVTGVGVTFDVCGIENMNVIACGDVPNSTDFVSDVNIQATVKRARIDTALEDTNNEFFSGGGKGATIQFRARNVRMVISAIDCDVGLSIESANSNDRWLENIHVDLLAEDCARTSVFLSGSKDAGNSSLVSSDFTHSLYPGVVIRGRVVRGNTAQIVHPIGGAAYNNWEQVGVVTSNYASGVDLDLYVANPNRVTLVRGPFNSSRIKVAQAELTHLQDGWDTNALIASPNADNFYMPDNVFEANVHAKNHSGVWVRPHRDAATGLVKLLTKSDIKIKLWCETTTGEITQLDGTTDGFGASVDYVFRDMATSPIKEIVGKSYHTPIPQWSLAALGGRVALQRESPAVFAPGVDSTVTAAGTTTLTANSAPVQVFTGSAVQTVVLPTTGIRAGQAYTVINNSSGTVTVQAANTNFIVSVLSGRVLVLIPIIDTPVASTDWHIISATLTFTSGSAVTNSAMLRDNNGDAFANNFIGLSTSVVTAAGTTTLTIASRRIQVFTGSTTQNVLLPTTSVLVGQTYTIINQSSGAVTVKSSGANTVDTVAAGAAEDFIALAATPTTAAHWAKKPWA